MSISPRRRRSGRNHSTANDACQNLDGQTPRRAPSIAGLTNMASLTTAEASTLVDFSHSPVFLSDNEDDDIQSAICQKGSLNEQACSTITPPLLAALTLAILADSRHSMRVDTSPIRSGRRCNEEGGRG